MSSPSLPRPAWATVAPALLGPWGPPRLEGGLGSDPIDRPDPVDLAYAKGFEDGFHEGGLRAREQLTPVRQALVAAIAAVESEIAMARMVGEANLAALALVMARWLFQREVESSPETMEALVRKAVALLPAGAPIEIAAHPLDLERLSGQVELTEPDGRALIVHWVSEPSLDRGSFRVIGRERLVDGRVDVALRALYERLVD